MALLDIFKFKKKRGDTRPLPKADHNRSDVAAPAAAAAEADRSRTGRIVPGVLLSAHITEKSAATERSYAFVVASDATKNAIKRAVELRYGVAVAGVRVMTMPSKIRRRGMRIGHRPEFKKAIVTLVEGATINIQ